MKNLDAIKYYLVGSSAVDNEHRIKRNHQSTLKMNRYKSFKPESIKSFPFQNFEMQLNATLLVALLCNKREMNQNLRGRPGRLFSASRSRGKGFEMGKRSALNSLNQISNK